VAFEDCVRAYGADFEVPDDIEAQLLNVAGETSQSASARLDDAPARTRP
jgi:hypothetical protein